MPETPDTPLTTAAREVCELNAELAQHLETSKRSEQTIRDAIRERQSVLNMAADGIDFDKVALAKTVVFAGVCATGGAEWQSCIRDAIQQLSTGRPVGPYTNLWNEYFGTKNYDRWIGQRSDHGYGMGPRHGSTVFSIGLRQTVRDREPRELTPEETEAAIYYFLNIVRIQEAEDRAKASSGCLTLPRNQPERTPMPETPALSMANEWPRHADGSPKKMGEMTQGERRECVTRLVARPTGIKRQLAELADDWRLLGWSEAEIADLIEFNRPRLIARTQDRGPVSHWGGRVTINEHSTMNHQQQGTGRS